MSVLQSFLRAHRVISFYILVFAISFGGFLALVGLSGSHVTLQRSFTNPLFMLVVFVTLVGPMLAGIIMTMVVYGKKGLHDLISRFLRWKVAPRWYACAILAAPVTVFGALCVLSIISPAFIPGIITSTNKGAVILPSLIISIIGPMLEETGWTGFAIPELRKRYPVFSAGIIAGILWGAWHGLSNIWFVGTSNGSVPLVIYASAILFSFLPPFRILMVWVYDHTKSLLVAYLMHVSLVFFWLIATPAEIAGVHMVTWYLVWAAILWGLVAVIAVKRGFSERRT